MGSQSIGTTKAKTGRACHALKKLADETWISDVKKHAMNLVRNIGVSIQEDASPDINEWLEDAAAILFPLQEIERLVQSGTDGEA